MGRFGSTRGRIRNGTAWLGLALAGAGLSSAIASATSFTTSTASDRLSDLPELPPPLCRTPAWVEAQAEAATELGSALALGEVGDRVDRLRDSLSSHGWDSVPSLILAWREFDLESADSSAAASALAEWFNGLGLESTLAWQDGQPAANRNEVADLYDAYLTARVRTWPEFGDASNSTFLQARVWADDLLRNGASRTEVRDARKGIGEAQWDAVPAVLAGIKRIDLGDAASVKKVKTLLRLMERFPGAPDESWAEGSDVASRLANLALLEDYMAVSLAQDVRSISARPKPTLVSKRDWVQWERQVEGFLASGASASGASASGVSDSGAVEDLLALGSPVRGVLENAFLDLDLLEGEDYASGEALDRLLRQLEPTAETPPWTGIDGVHPALAARAAVYSWFGGRPSTVAGDPGGVSKPVQAGGKFGGRFGGRKRLSSRGGVDIAEALGSGLAWLAANQQEDGSWSAAPWAEFDGEPAAGHEVGLTALVLLAFASDGQVGESKLYSVNVTRGLRWLLDQQDPKTGAFGTPRSHDWIYDHAIATQVVAEYAFFTQEAAFLESTTLAIQYLESQREPKGAWRYGKRRGGGEDTSVTAWVVTALSWARTAGVEVNQESLELANAWFEKVTDPETGRAGYAEPGSFSARVMGVNDEFPSKGCEAMSAAALWGTLLTMEEPEITPRIEGYAKLLAASPPVWEDKKIDFYYWYWGSISAWQVGGKNPWDIWERGMRSALVPNQRKDGEFEGSWDPKGAWCHVGRRVYSTAMGVLILGTYYRYGKLVR